MDYKAFTHDCQAVSRVPTLVGLFRRLKAQLYTPLAIIANRFYRATGHRLFAGEAFGFVFRLLTDKRISIFKTAGEIVRGRVAADVAINTSRIDIERAVNILSYAVAGIRHIPLRPLAKNYLRAPYKTKAAAVAACFSSARHGGSRVRPKLFSFRLTTSLPGPNSAAAV
jgi:hypothetical protein